MSYWPFKALQTKSQILTLDSYTGLFYGSGVSNLNYLGATAGTVMSLEGLFSVQEAQKQTNKKTNKKTPINISKNLAFAFFFFLLNNTIL